MSIHTLDKIFQPKTIAVVGDSERRGSIGLALMRNLIGGGYTGEIIPINPRRQTVWEKPAYPSILDLKSPVDLAILAAPITSAPELVKRMCRCKRRGCGYYFCGREGSRFKR